ncbi:thioredoxin reductase [Bradyrhizobium sp. USDA 4449]
MSRADTVIIGAGPYGLSLAVHLATKNINHRIFGQPMQFWSKIAAAGGERYLKSFCFGTDISTPWRGFSFADYSRPRGLETFEPCSIKDFAAYGLWFQQSQVDWVEPFDVVRIERRNEEFAITLTNGESVSASRVVIATGLAGFANIPAEVAPLAPELIQHTSTIGRFADYRGLDVAVVGGGQSALEAAALLHEVGARAQLIVRRPLISWMRRASSNRNLWQRIRSPISELGTGPKAWALTSFPGAMYLVPAPLRTHFVKTHLPPEGAWWLRPRVEHQVPLHCGTKLIGARHEGGRAVLSLRNTHNRTEFDLAADRVVVGTGYNVDVDRLGFLDRQLRSEIVRIEKAPKLNATFESSVPGLYFIGPASATSFGPLFRFVAGTAYSAKIVSRRLASATSTK